jgi:hypothetical protein
MYLDTCNSFSAERLLQMTWKPTSAATYEVLLIACASFCRLRDLFLQEHTAAASILTRIRVQSVFDPDSFLTMLALLRESLNSSVCALVVALLTCAGCFFVLLSRPHRGLARCAPLSAAWHCPWARDARLNRPSAKVACEPVSLCPRGTIIIHRHPVLRRMQTTNYFVSGKKPALGETWTYMAHTQLQLEHIEQADLTIERPPRRLVLTRSPHTVRVPQ